MKILVADDSKTTLSLITASLQKLGHEVVPANNGEEAIYLFVQEHPDLVILDVVMQGMNGFECAKQLRKLNQEEEWIPIIFLSASVDDASIAEGIDAGGDDYLTKPFSNVTLEAKIKAMQRIAEMRKKLFATTEELKVLSAMDALTGIYNRLQFEKSLKEKVAASDRHHHQIAVMFVDLDHFKTINDSLGHHIGDALLKEVAHRLKTSLRLDDFVARIGGDEFVVILTEVEDESVVKEVANKILNSLSEVFILDGNNLKISASIGIIIYPYPSIDRDNLLQSADIAMYHAKGLGRNNYQFFTESLNKTYHKQISLEHELKFAIERKQFSILYQPIFNLITKQLVGMEALLRWRHPEFGVISPNIFIKLAEESGLILPIGSWALKNICVQGAKWFNQGYKEFKLSINVSLQQLLQENFYQTSEEIITKTQIPPRLIVFELTETTLITYNNHLLDIIQKLNKLGVKISIDDFGTRYSTLTSLRSLPISSLKIDKDFLKDLSIDPKNSIIVRSLIALGTNLNLQVIAKGIQTDEQVQFLILNGCTLGQGFLLSKPLTEKEMTKVLEEQSRYPDYVTVV